MNFRWSLVILEIQKWKCMIKHQSIRKLNQPRYHEEMEEYGWHWATWILKLQNTEIILQYHNNNPSVFIRQLYHWMSLPKIKHPTGRSSKATFFSQKRLDMPVQSVDSIHRLLKWQVQPVMVSLVQQEIGKQAGLISCWTLPPD